MISVCFILDAPVIAGDKQEIIEAFINEPKDLFCDTSGTEPIDIEWLRDGKVIEFSNDRRSPTSYRQVFVFFFVTIFPSNKCLFHILRKFCKRKKNDENYFNYFNRFRIILIDFVRRSNVAHFIGANIRYCTICLCCTE